MHRWRRTRNLRDSLVLQLGSAPRLRMIVSAAIANSRPFARIAALPQTLKSGDCCQLTRSKSRHKERVSQPTGLANLIRQNLTRHPGRSKKTDHHIHLANSIREIRWPSLPRLGSTLRRPIPPDPTTHAPTEPKGHQLKQKAACGLAELTSPSRVGTLRKPSA